jgi:hypothetical protein
MVDKELSLKQRSRGKPIKKCTTNKPFTTHDFADDDRGY